jgi:aspartate/methionine/tyrosine aminotransferase
VKFVRPAHDQFRIAKMAEIVVLKAQLAEASEARARAEAREAELVQRLAMARREFESIPVAAVERSREADDEERRYPALGGKSIIERIADHFRSQPAVSFSPAEVMAYTGIPTGNIEAVRASFKRLVTRGVLRHVGHAKYQLNELEKDHPTQSSPRNCG